MLYATLARPLFSLAFEAVPAWLRSGLLSLAPMLLPAPRLSTEAARSMLSKWAMPLAAGALGMVSIASESTGWTTLSMGCLGGFLSPLPLGSSNPMCMHCVTKAANTGETGKLIVVSRKQHKKKGTP